MTDKIDRISDKNALAEFIEDLAFDYKNRGESWQNATVPDYLHAIAAYLKDGGETDGDPLKAAAKLLYMGKIYE